MQTNKIERLNNLVHNISKMSAINEKLKGQNDRIHDLCSDLWLSNIDLQTAINSTEETNTNQAIQVKNLIAEGSQLAAQNNTLTNTVKILEHRLEKERKRALIVSTGAQTLQKKQRDHAVELSVSIDKAKHDREHIDKLCKKVYISTRAEGIAIALNESNAIYIEELKLRLELEKEGHHLAKGILKITEDQSIEKSRHITALNKVVDANKAHVKALKAYVMSLEKDRGQV